jgi:hypothetical protein
MIDDYKSQRAALQSKRSVTPHSAISPHRGEAAGPWKSKEKQSRLFNTAPVLQPETAAFQSPTKSGGGSNGSSSSSSKNNAQVDLELTNLERAFAIAKERIASQKKNAVRWIERQKSRMSIQVDAVRLDRNAVYPYLKKRNELYDNFHEDLYDIWEKAGATKGGGGGKQGAVQSNGNSNGGGDGSSRSGGNVGLNNGNNGNSNGMILGGGSVNNASSSHQGSVAVKLPSASPIFGKTGGAAAATGSLATALKKR